MKKLKDFFFGKPNLNGLFTAGLAFFFSFTISSAISGDHLYKLISTIAFIVGLMIYIDLKVKGDL